MKNISSEDVCEKLSDIFELYELTYVNDESLYERKHSVRRNKNSELIMTENSTDLKIKAKAMAKQFMNNKYSKKNVAAFVNSILGDKNEITTKEIPITDDDTYIFTLLSVLQADDKDSEYTVYIAEKNIISEKYELPLIIYRRKVKN